MSRSAPPAARVAPPDQAWTGTPRQLWRLVRLRRRELLLGVRRPPGCPRLKACCQRRDGLQARLQCLSSGGS